MSAANSPVPSDGVRRKDVARNRLRLIDAAEELVAEHGLQLSFAALARRAGLGVATVYRHFPDVETLTAALVERRVDRIVWTLEAASSRPDPLDALREAVLGVCVLQAEDRGIWEALIGAPKRLQSAQRRMYPLSVRLFERAAATGRMHVDFALSDFVAMLWIGNALSGWLGVVDRDAWRRYIEVLLTGFGAGSGIVPPALPLNVIDRALEQPRHAGPVGGT